VGRDAPPPLVVANPFLPVEIHANRLPHWQQGETAQFVTWRLGDSLPPDKLELWKEEEDTWLRVHSEPWDEPSKKEYHQRFSNRLEEWLDAGDGSCLLRDEVCRKIVTDALHYFDDQRYDLRAFVVMPNHVHVLFSLHPPHLLQQVLHSWKSHTAKALNRHLGYRGKVWQEDYWDRLIRSDEHFRKCIRYIRSNPEKALLTTGEYTLYEKEGSGGILPPQKWGGTPHLP